MLTGLGHHPLVGSHYKESRIYPPDPGQHILDKVLMPRHIHDADPLTTGQGQPGKAQINGHLPFLLFFEPVWVDAGQCVDQCGFSVVYMTCCSNYAHVPFFLRVGIGRVLYSFLGLSSRIRVISPSQRRDSWVW